MSCHLVSCPLILVSSHTRLVSSHLVSSHLISSHTRLVSGVEILFTVRHKYKYVGSIVQMAGIGNKIYFIHT